MAGGFGEARDRVLQVGGALSARVRERPYPTLGLALAAGYVAGGGLFSSLSRLLARAALGALLAPGVRERLRGPSGELGSMHHTGAA
jgi:hypothetical protein